MNGHHKAAAVTIAGAGVMACGLGAAFGAADQVGIWQGLYFGVTTATTTGYGDVTPRGWLPHVLAVALMITAIPLWSASFALFTSGLAGLHMDRAEHRIRAHVREELAGVTRCRPGQGEPRGQ